MMTNKQKIILRFAGSGLVFLALFAIFMVLYPLSRITRIRGIVDSRIAYKYVEMDLGEILERLKMDHGVPIISRYLPTRHHKRVTISTQGEVSVIGTLNLLTDLYDVQYAYTNASVLFYDDEQQVNDFSLIDPGCVDGGDSCDLVLKYWGLREYNLQYR